ncbi:hypothetical protein PFISCL1PPCAC_20071, partial [Pristionchus fissidentatus]
YILFSRMPPKKRSLSIASGRGATAPTPSKRAAVPSTPAKNKAAVVTKSAKNAAVAPIPAKKAIIERTPSRKAPIVRTPVKKEAIPRIPSKKAGIARTVAKKAAVARTPAKKAVTRGRPVKAAKEGRNNEDENTARETSPPPIKDLIKKKNETKGKDKRLKDIPSNATKIFYPFENLDLFPTLDGTVRAVQKAVSTVLDEDAIRWTVPIEKMAEICKRAEKHLSQRQILDCKSDDIPLLDAGLDEALEHAIDADLGIDRSVFRQELIKYILIATSKFNKLSTGTLLSVVRDLGQMGFNLSEWENGYPAKVASKCHNFYGLSSSEFRSQSSQMQLKMNKSYCESALRFHLDVENFLDKKHGELKGANVDGWVKDAEGKERERQLAIAFHRNRRMGRHIKSQYEQLTTKMDDGVNPLYAEFRSVVLSGKIGVRSEEEEAKIERDFNQTPLNIMKSFSDQWKRARGEPVVDDSIHLDVGTTVPHVPSLLVPPNL